MRMPFTVFADPLSGKCRMHVVEVRRQGADLAAVMAQTRTWADHRKAQPALFEVTFFPDRQVRFRIEFRVASDASAFALVFGGKVLTERGQRIT